MHNEFDNEFNLNPDINTDNIDESSNDDDISFNDLLSAQKQEDVVDDFWGKDILEGNRSIDTSKGANQKSNFSYGRVDTLLQKTDTLQQLQIKVDSAKDILRKSKGEVKNSETFHYRSLKSIKYGLTCEIIFGPLKSFECNCGIQYPYSSKESICEKCKVPIDYSHVRRERRGHIVLPSPVINPLFVNYLYLFLDLSTSQIGTIINFENYVVTDPKLTRLNYKQILSEKEYLAMVESIGEDEFTAHTGSHAIYVLLEHIDINELYTEKKEQLDKKIVDIKRKRIITLLNYLDGFMNNNGRLFDLVFTVLPVLPAGLRPMVQLENGKFVSSDLNDKYRTVVYRKNRLDVLIGELDSIVPLPMINHSKRMLTSAVHSLILGDNKNVVQKSLFNILQGKTGLLRNKMLGKRSDFTARAVITTSDKLRLHEAGIPKRILKDLFRPYIYRLLRKYGLSITTSSARVMVDNEDAVVWDLLEDVIKDRYIMLNRAPTLYSLGIQAFKPKMIEGDAIQLHPLVCKAYNADFDGDQMAIHFGMFLESQLESREIIASVKNVLNPGSGKVIIVPTKDMVLGLYYMTLADENSKKDPKDLMTFSDLWEIEQALNANYIKLNEYIYCKYKHIDENGKKKHEMVVTTAGRMKIWSKTPEHPKLEFNDINKVFKKGIIEKLLDKVYNLCGRKGVVSFAEILKDFGFKYAVKSGVTVGRNFNIKVENMDSLSEKVWDHYLKYEDQYRNNFITKEDKHKKIIGAVNKGIGEMNLAIANWLSNNPFNASSMIISSGARGSVEQLRQMIGVKGLSLNIGGGVSGFLCKGNYKDGLNSHEFFESSHGARKGGKDRALSTAVSGYFARRMTDVAQDCITSSSDCGTDDGYYVRNVISGNVVQSNLFDSLHGRVLAKDIINKKNNKIIFKKGNVMTKDCIDILKNYQINEVKIRSPIFCKNTYGICCMCYGLNTATNNIVDVGRAVGIIAAQSIGEPGSQLTMRTFQSGSVYKGSLSDGKIYAGFNGKISILGTFLTLEDKFIVTSGSCKLLIKNDYDDEICRYNVPYGTEIYVKEGDKVHMDDLIAEMDNFYDVLFTSVDGYAKYENIVLDVNCYEQKNLSTGLKYKFIANFQEGKVNQIIPSIVIVDKNGVPIVNENGYIERHYLLEDMMLNVQDGESVSPGKVLAKIKVDTTISGDIIDGLTKVINILEVRNAKNPAILSPCNGYVNIVVESPNLWRVQIIKDKILGDKKIDSEEILYSTIIHKTHFRRLSIKQNDYVEAGEILVTGDINLHDLLTIGGIEQLIHYFLNYIQSVYLDQCVQLSNQHLEILLKQMLRLVEIEDPSKTKLTAKGVYDVALVCDLNKLLIQDNHEEIKYKNLITSITKAAVNNPSFLSSASFQETQKVFTNSALKFSKDYLRCLKSATIVGKMANIGTGFAYYKILEATKQYAAERAKRRLQT